jgi:hypothetical protein
MPTLEKPTVQILWFGKILSYPPEYGFQRLLIHDQIMFTFLLSTIITKVLCVAMTGNLARQWVLRNFLTWETPWACSLAILMFLARRLFTRRISYLNENLLDQKIKKYSYRRCCMVLFVYWKFAMEATLQFVMLMFPWDQETDFGKLVEEYRTQIGLWFIGSVMVLIACNSLVVNAPMFSGVSEKIRKEIQDGGIEGNDVSRTENAPAPGDRKIEDIEMGTMSQELGTE